MSKQASRKNGLLDVESYPATPSVQPPLLKAVTIGQVSGLKMNKQDGSWDITVTVERERVPNNIEKWGYQTVAVAVMKDAKEAEKALEDDIFGP
jgi:hypothetical protein